MNMSVPRHPPASSRADRWSETRAVWFPRLRNIAIAVVVGLVLGQLIYKPSPRIVKSLVGFAIVYAALRFPIPVSISAFVLLFPFPFSVTTGSSNTIFAFLITAMWLAQVVLRTARPAGGTPLDLPIVILLGAYLLSFNNVANAYALGQGLINMSTIIAGIFVYYLIVHSVRDERTLRRLVLITAITGVACFVVAIYELVFPGRPMIKGWILSTTYYDPDSIERGLRVGGPFGDFELFAEYCALMFPIMLFQMIRATNRRSRMIWAGIAFLNIFILMATVTRGATIALLTGLIYLMVRIRRSMSPRTFIMTLGTAFMASAAIEFYLSNFTVSGSVFDRLVNTKFIGGLPDSRTFWPQILERCFEHIWIGHGPYYEVGAFGAERLTTYFWPHNGYLYYLHTVGLLGTSAFLWILGKLWWTSSRLCRNTLTAGYARSLLLVLNVMILIFVIDQMKIEYLRNQNYQFWPWIMFGLTVATANVVRIEAAQAEVGIPRARPKTERSGTRPLPDPDGPGQNA